MSKPTAPAAAADVHAHAVAAVSAVKWYDLFADVPVLALTLRSLNPAALKSFAATLKQAALADSSVGPAIAALLRVLEDVGVKLPA